MLKFIQNTGDYFSSNYFDEDFTTKVLSKTGYAAEDIKEFNKRITPLKDKYFRFKQSYFEGKQRTKDKVLESHQFHTEVLNVLGYDGAQTNYKNLFHLSEHEVIPVRHILYRGDQPHLMIMEMQALIKEDDTDADGLFEQRYNVETEEQTNPPQRYHRSQWEKVFEIPPNVKISPVVINKAISELFLLEQHLRPKYILLLAGNMAFLLEQEKWFRGSYLQIDLEELFTEATANRNANYYALFYFLLGKETLAPESNMVLLDQLDEDSHKSAYEVTKDLKEGIIHAVEALANEALYYRKEKLQESFDETDDVFEQQVKDDCLKIIYRLLFIFYAESREDLDILPSDDRIYQRGYSLEMLRDLEQVPLYSDSSLNGYFFHESLSKLFHVLSSGYREKETSVYDKEKIIAKTDTPINKSFKVRHIDSPLFNNAALNQLATVKFRNKVWQDILCRLSLSKEKKGKPRGRISYANLGINQLGSVYESLLAYRGFYAEQDYIEVHVANKPNEGTYLVPRSRRDDFEENEILKDDNEQAVITKKGTFVYRLSGRDRQKSASYYTPEVLTQCTVKYTLKPILEKLDKEEMKATELLELKLLEPAMGAAAFQNEMINQLAEAYINYRQKELNKRVAPDLFKEELQKVKAYIATNNVYGVDLNPTAIELGKLSLWLNVIHKDMETPFFSNRLAVGNAVVGAWLKVYPVKDLLEDVDSRGITIKKQSKKEWWETAPRILEFKPTKDYDKIKHGRKQDEIYHFLLPDKNMVPSAGIKMLKAEYDTENKAVAKWKKDWILPIKKSELEQLKKICSKIDELLAEYYQFQRTINLQTASKHTIFGAYKNAEQTSLAIRSYDEKEKLADQRNRHNAPYFKLKMVMDYWCSLWFWDVRQAAELPSRQQYWQDIAGILELDLDKTIEVKKKAPAINPTIQPKLFYSGGEQLKIGQTTEDVVMLFEEAVVEYSNRKDLFDNNQRLTIVTNLAKQYFFFHPQLEFLEVFWERGGFDLIAGNPPWVNSTFDEPGIVSEVLPEVKTRDLKAPQISLIAKDLLKTRNDFKEDLFSSLIESESLQQFLGAIQNYYLLDGRNNLYKSILSNGLCMLSKSGTLGLIHPEGIYDDPTGSLLREEIYPRLKYHFQFRNELGLFQETNDHGRLIFSINVYSGNKGHIRFISINNLFHPNTIETSLIHNGMGDCGGIKKWNDSLQKYAWNIDGHEHRALIINEEKLRVIQTVFDPEAKWYNTKLVSIHANTIIDILKKLSEFSVHVSDIESFASDGWNETNAPKEGIIKRESKWPIIENYELIIQGPNFYVQNFLTKCARVNASEGSHYDVIDLMEISENFVPRTNFVPAEDLNTFSKRIKCFEGKSGNQSISVDYWCDLYKLTFSKMLNLTAERTLQPSIIFPKTSHIHSVLSLVFKDYKHLLEVAGLTSSLVYDFYIKTLGKTNLYETSLSELPFDLDKKYKHLLISRTLLLNCLNNYYTALWEEAWQDIYQQDQWSKRDRRLKPFDTLTKEWQWDTPLRNWYERRQSLLEIDVITAMALSLGLDELILIYNVQFPVLQQNEDDTWYDTKGNIVFTCSKGLIGVGVDRNVWEQIRTLKAGEAYEHTITKSELYQGKKITYHAPFDKCDRVEDYRVAWEWFEKIFN